MEKPSLRVLFKVPSKGRNILELILGLISASLLGATCTCPKALHVGLLLGVEVGFYSENTVSLPASFAVLL